MTARGAQGQIRNEIARQSSGPPPRPASKIPDMTPETRTGAARALSSIRWLLGCGALVGAVACQKDAAPSVQGEPARAPAAVNAPASAAAPSAPGQVELAKYAAPSASQAAPAQPPAEATPAAEATPSAGASGPTASKAPAAPAPAADAPAGKAAPGKSVQGAVVTGEPFSAWLQAVSPLAAGSPATVEAVLVAKPPYHCNAEYPHKFKLGAPPSGLSYPQTTVKGMQVTAERSVLRIPVVAQSPGPAQVTGTLQFSVCTDERCLIEKRELSLNLEVK